MTMLPGIKSEMTQTTFCFWLKLKGGPLDNFFEGGNYLLDLTYTPIYSI